MMQEALNDDKVLTFHVPEMMCMKNCGKTIQNAISNFSSDNNHQISVTSTIIELESKLVHIHYHRNGNSSSSSAKKDDITSPKHPLIADLIELFDVIGFDCVYLPTSKAISQHRIDFAAATAAQK